MSILKLRDLQERKTEGERMKAGGLRWIEERGDTGTRMKRIYNRG